jgi:murein DD-endopeptidase MepM/ murein hydrolase activator NlpD
VLARWAGRRSERATPAAGVKSLPGSADVTDATNVRSELQLRLPSRVIALATAVVLVVGGTAATGATPAAASPAYDAALDLTFPVGGPSSFIDDYHHWRGGGTRRHRATDIMAPYGAPVYAAVGGTISFITGLDGGTLHGSGWMIYVRGDDGRTYVYIHLGRQDRGWEEAYAPGMARGVRVERGQHIGFNGCSGNASCDAPHLHFEIHDDTIVDPYGTNRRNPYASLVDARARGDVVQAADAVGSGCSGTAYALAGDWDRSGRDGVGWWCDGRVRLRTANGRIITFSYGRRGDIPLVGDWTGDGIDTFGIVRDRTWHLKDTLGGGTSDRSFTYGQVSRGDVPIAGDWDGTGRDTIGIIRDGEWHLRTSLSGGPGEIVFTYGRITRGDRPLIGDWNGDGRDTIGIVRDGQWHLRHSLTGGPGETVYTYGRVRQGDAPVMGDWTRDGITTPGIARGTEWHQRDVHAGGAADRVVILGP